MNKPSDTMSLSRELLNLGQSIDNLKGTTMAETTEVAGTEKPKKAPVKKAPAKKPKAAATPRAAANPNHTTLAELCKKAKVEPVVARRRLRAAEEQRPESGQWTWPASKIEKITKIIKGE